MLFLAWEEFNLPMSLLLKVRRQVQGLFTIFTSRVGPSLPSTKKLSRRKQLNKRKPRSRGMWHSLIKFSSLIRLTKQNKPTTLIEKGHRVPVLLQRKSLKKRFRPSRGLVSHPRRTLQVLTVEDCQICLKGQSHRRGRQSRLAKVVRT